MSLVWTLLIIGGLLRWRAHARYRRHADRTSRAFAARLARERHDAENDIEGRIF